MSSSCIACLFSLGRAAVLRCALEVLAWSPTVEPWTNLGGGYKDEIWLGTELLGMALNNRSLKR